MRQIEAGSVVLPPRAVRLLLDHLRRSPAPSDLATRALLSDLSRCHVRDSDALVFDTPDLLESELGTAEVARLLGISQSAVRQRVIRGTLRAKRVGGRLRFDPEDL